jgi:hypothetical protein
MAFMGRGKNTPAIDAHGLLLECIHWKLGSMLALAEI